MSEAPRQTKLGYNLRQVADKLEREKVGFGPLIFCEEAAVAWETLEGKITKARVAAFNLDRAAISMGYKGAQIKNLANYYEALRVYEFVAGKPYAG